MDPNATLKAIDRFLTEGDIPMAKEAVKDLLEWIRKGGFSPTWGKYPNATRFVEIMS